MKYSLAILCILAVCNLTNSIDAQTKSDEKKTEEKQKFKVADGWLIFEAPSKWKKVAPKIHFIHADFTIPKVEGDPKDGRITFSVSGGGTKANIDRWIGQFKGVDPDDEKQVKRESKEIDGTKVHMVTIRGTFFDSAGGGPMGPKTEREKYVLMGASVESDGDENVYVKAYGPEKTIKANKKAIEELLAGMKATDG